ncbi:MAG: hypothetical protein J6W88_01280 [Bacteroidales bacterium]|nr:hypothetical protein [Bacteroidales bacterium]
MNISKWLSLIGIILMAVMTVSCNNNKTVDDNKKLIEEWEVVSVSSNCLDWKDVTPSCRYASASDSIMMSIGDGDTILTRYAICGNVLY